MNFKTLLRQFVNFPLNTSIHGILYICNNKLANIVRTIWLLMFLLAAVTCIVGCVNNVQQYLKFDVTVSITRQQAANLEFPSITLCSTYLFKRSMIGNSSSISIILAALLSKNTQDFVNIAKQGNRFCASNRSTHVTDYMEKNHIFMGGKIEPNEIMDVMKDAFTDFRKEVLKCWWNDKDIQCNTLLMNIQNEDQLCFAFNLGNDFTKDAMLFGKTTGINISSYNEKMFNVTNVASSKVRFLVNVNQSEYCGASSRKSGAGYFAMISEKSDIPLNMFQAPLLLGPGYAHNVVIKPIFHQRHTELLDRCANFVNVYILSATNKKYMQNVCYFQCAVVEVIKTCKCYPMHLASFHKAFLVIAQKANLNNSDVKVCDEQGMICVGDFQRNVLLKSSIQKICPICKTPCFLSTYDFSVTSTRLTLNLFKRDIYPDDVDQYGNLSTIRKNIAYFSFGFESSFVEVIVERQAVTLIDVFIFVGGNIGLFLGMSFMSVFEIIIEIILHLLVFCFKSFVAQCTRKKRKTRKIHTDKLTMQAKENSASILFSLSDRPTTAANV